MLPMCPTRRCTNSATHTQRGFLRAAPTSSLALEFPLIPHPDYDDTHYPGHHQSQEGDHIESQPVPKQDAFNRAFNRLTPETLRDINQLVVQAAVQLGLEDGKTLRDTTVVESN